jgi:hypothetical protein
LGPELTTEEHVNELKTLGVKRIINIAAECDDDHGLRLRENFDRYFHIPMRDIVEEENITKGVREACDILGKKLYIQTRPLLTDPIKTTLASTQPQPTSTAKRVNPAQ